ncbi:MAG: DUF1801 domain-containing protein [Cyclobacteriaceae bacterium]|nr:DUF1801 domain-containing protein [Cyclobacteriaceae bacterium]
MAELKTKKNDNDIIKFLNEIDNEERKNDCFKLLELFEQLTNERPKMWGQSIVGFGSYHYKYDSGREGDWFLTGFSPRKANLTIYITAGFKEYDAIMKGLGKYKTGSSCLYVKKLSDIDTDKLKMLVEKSVACMKKRYE